MSIFLDLSVHIKNEIENNGPISIYDFMKHALQTAKAGYYAGGNNAILGKKGDFVTSPEISQLFGEIVGIWCLNIWKLNNCPKSFNLIELGPGKGTMMKDILRATKNVPAFHKAMSISLVEINQNLIEEQKKQIDHKRVEWFSSYEEVPRGFSIVVANEFFDALPINQYIKKNGEWYINMVGLHKDNQSLCIDQFSTEPNIKEFLDSKYPNITDDAIIETQDESNILVGEIAKNINEYGGSALIIDYGYIESMRDTYISTLQAVKNHEFSPIFEEIGNADISSHINFTSLQEVAELYKTYTYGPITQGEFLNNMYIELRKNILIKNATPKQKLELDTGYERLISPEHMGKLFKTIAISGKKFDAKEIGF